MSSSKKPSVNVLISKDKSPFEKIKSGSEARRIYERLPKEALEFFCKGDGALFSFRPTSFDPENGLEGRIVLFEETNIKNEPVVVNFVVDQERYYTTCEFFHKDDHGLLKLAGTLFRLERRSHYRVTLPAHLERACNIINQDGRAVFVSAVVLDISQGGARFQILKGKLKDLKQGVRIRCALHIKDKWKFELLAQVMHVLPGEKTDVLGAQFLNVPEGMNRKLLSMMLELQREVLREQA